MIFAVFDLEHRFCVETVAVFVAAVWCKVPADAQERGANTAWRQRNGETPRSMSGAFHSGPGSVAVGLAAAGPDQGVGLGVSVVEEVGVDRSVEARIVQLDREIITALGGALRPGGPDLSVMRCTA